MPTVVDLAGAKYPTTFKGNAILPMEGTSLRPAFEGKSLDRKRPIFWEHEGNKAVRDGKWKLVQKWHMPWELYDMEADRTELHDVIAEHPGRRSSLWLWANCLEGLGAAILCRSVAGPRSYELGRGYPAVADSQATCRAGCGCR